MIVRSILFFIILIVLPDVWIDYHFLRTRRSLVVWKRLLWWIPCMLMLIFTCWLAAQDGFIPHNKVWIDIYLWLLGIFVIPKAICALCSFVGWLFNHRRGARSLVTVAIGSLLAVCSAILYAYGSLVGFNNLEVRHVELWYSDLPEAFDGYRLVHVSDLHVGTYSGSRRKMLQKTVDSIIAQKPDIICFTGDLQNVVPEEVEEVSGILSQMKNTYSVLGNHDYADYALFREARNVEHGTSNVDGLRVGEPYGLGIRGAQIVERMKEVQRSMLGYDLLDNESRRITRDSSSIYIVGTGNYSKPPRKQGQRSIDYSDINRAMHGVPNNAFVIMLQHNPQAWDDIILPLSNKHKPTPQLTLSGHTHGGQIGIGSIRPTRLTYPEDAGLYQQNGRCLYVTSGVGGLVPMRLGVPPEIVVITLRKKVEGPKK